MATPHIIPIAVIQPTAAEQVAKSLISNLNECLTQRIEQHKHGFNQFWRSGLASPDDILLGMGTDAVRWLQAASASVSHIAALATIAGKTLSDFLPDEYWKPLREFLPHADGTVTLG